MDEPEIYDQSKFTPVVMKNMEEFWKKFDD